MKHSAILTLVLMITLILSACGAQPAPPPTVNPLELQGTVAAQALTMIAETQAAIPTATPLPPTPTVTNTPPVTNTMLPLPTLGATFTAVPSNNSGGDPCINTVLPPTLKGETVKIRIGNSTKAEVSLTVYLNQTTPQVVCGYRSYALDAGQSLVIGDLVEGCFTLWAWNPDPEEYFMVTNGTSCIDNSLDSWVFDISTSSIELRR